MMIKQKTFSFRKVVLSYNNFTNFSTNQLKIQGFWWFPFCFTDHNLKIAEMDIHICVIYFWLEKDLYIAKNQKLCQNSKWRNFAMAFILNLISITDTTTYPCMTSIISYSFQPLIGAGFPHGC